MLRSEQLYKDMKQSFQRLIEGLYDDFSVTSPDEVTNEIFYGVLPEVLKELIEENK